MFFGSGSLVGGTLNILRSLRSFFVRSSSLFCNKFFFLLQGNACPVADFFRGGKLLCLGSGFLAGNSGLLPHQGSFLPGKRGGSCSFFAVRSLLHRRLTSVRLNRIAKFTCT